MDTRSKILAAEASWPAMPRPLVVVTGYFDVLQAEHARELQEVRDRTRAAALLVVVLPPPNPMLPQRVRAELVAALRVVDYVLVSEYEDLDRLIGALQPAEVVRMESAHVRRTRQLIEHVHRRQTC